MQKVAVTVEEEHLYELKAIQYIHDCDSRSEAFRRLIVEYEKLQTELETVKNERNKLIRLRKQRQELYEYVEDEY